MKSQHVLLVLCVSPLRGYKSSGSNEIILNKSKRVTGTPAVLISHQEAGYVANEEH